MRKKLYVSVLGLVAVAALTAGFFGFHAANADGKGDDVKGVKYEVTVTNVTRGGGTAAGQILNGLVVATHNSKFDLFTLGQPATEGLAALAEDANTTVLVPALSGDSNVKDVQLSPTGAILPGQSASIIIAADGKHRFLSLATMLVTTNDAFAGLDGVPLPRKNAEYFAVAYDAGSEANTENCSDIPGPPCGNGGVRVTAGAEGYVSIHSGIHGIGSPLQILPEERDWRNPVAWITIKRLRNSKD